MFESLSKFTKKVFDKELCCLPDVESAICKRYEAAFEDEWLIEAAKLEPHRAVVECAEIDAIREVAYIATLKQTENTELAALVSDDFDLFCTALAVGYSSPFLCALWKSYSIGKFPNEPAFEENQLADLIKSFQN